MAQLASIRQMSGQVSRGSDAEYQADERAEVARLRLTQQLGSQKSGLGVGGDWAGGTLCG